MPRRPCSICIREDVQELDELLKAGNSCRVIGQPRGIHPRLLSEHFRRHRNGLHGHMRAGRAGAKALSAARKEISALIEAKSLYQRAVKLLDTAEKSGSPKEMRGWIAESRECLKLLAGINGELSPQNSVQVNVGVSVERARQAVEVMDEAETLTDAQLADRAVAVLEAYNASNPNDMRIVGQRLLAAGVKQTDTPPPAG